MTLYLDIIFVENLIMEMSIILATGLIIKCYKSFIRCLFASTISSLFYITTLIWKTSLYFQPIVVIIILIIAFKYSGIKKLFKEILLFYFVSFIFGGVSLAFMSFSTGGKMNIINGVIIGNKSIILIFLSAILAFILVIRVLNKKAKHIIKEIKIGWNNYEVKVKVLLDTGNLLRDPYTNKPVIVVEKCAVKELLKDNLKESFSKIVNCEKEIPLGMFLIPYKTISNNSYLLGFKPDYIVLTENKKGFDSVIGICDTKISETENYSGIFGINTLDGGVCGI